MKIYSPAIKNGILSPIYGSASPMEEELEKDGLSQHSFPIEWSDYPKETRSFALLFIDYDNVEDEAVPWIHWTVADIPSNTSMLPDNASLTDSSLVQGRNSFALPYGFYLDIDEKYKSGYVGPAPERPHIYELTIYALDTTLGLADGFYYNKMRNLMENHILDTSTIKLVYQPK